MQTNRPTDRRQEFKEEIALGLAGEYQPSIRTNKGEMVQKGRETRDFSSEEGESEREIRTNLMSWEKTTRVRVGR